MFYTLTGVYKPQGGQVIFDGEPLDYSKGGLTDVRSSVAVVLQNPDEQLFSSTVEEDIAFGPLNLGIRRAEINKRIDKVLKEVRMTEYRRSPLQQLSGGQRKRIAIAGALAVDPDIMILDEPTAGLDPQATQEVMELAEKLHNRGITVILATHDIDAAYAWADQIHVLRNGKCVYSGEPEGFYSDRREVHLCGQLLPMTFSLNQEVSLIRGVPAAPYPKDSSCYLAKFGGKKAVPGKIVCVPFTEGTLEERLKTAVSGCSGTPKIGVYGSDARYQLTEERSAVDFFFDALDSCFTEAVLGNDCVLVYDSCYKRTLREKLRKLRQFDIDISPEVIA